MLLGSDGEFRNDCDFGRIPQVDELRRVLGRLHGAKNGQGDSRGEGGGREAAAVAYRRGAQTIVRAALESALDSR